MNNEISKLLDELSFLSRETRGASFYIAHVKENGLYKVVFSNCVTRCSKFRPTDFQTALETAIKFLREERKLLDITETYTLFSV